MKYGELVTVGLKSFNQRAFIRAALEGVLSQTYRPLEIVISDDGSTDGTWEEIQDALKDRPESEGVSIVLNRNERNLGNMGNWLRIGELSHGEWIFKCDGDDVSEPTRVETSVRRLADCGTDSRIRVVCCGVVKIDAEGRELGRFKARSACYPLGAAMAFHRECFSRFPRPSDERIVDDEVFARRALMLGGELRIDVPLVRYRIGGGISSDCSDLRATELRCLRQFPANLNQCRVDLESVRRELGEAAGADWSGRLDEWERQQRLSVELRTAGRFADRRRAYLGVEKPPLWTAYRWKLLLYLLPRTVGDRALGCLTRMRYGNRGLLWTGLEKISVYGVNFIQGVVLARLLCPEDFGLSAMLGIFILIGGTLAESGLTGALIVKGYGPRLAELERSALRWNLVIAGGVCLALILSAPLIADWYGEPVLAPLMSVMCVSLVVNAASAVFTARLWRGQRFGRLAVVNVVGTLAGAAMAVAMAACGCGVWSIAAMCVCHACVRTVAARVASRGCSVAIREGEPESPPFRELLGYGLKLTASSVIDTGYVESYNLVLGKVFDPATVGLFARGDRWARLPGDVTGDVVGRVALPVLTRRGAGMREGWRFVRLDALLLWPGLVVLWIWATEIVTFVFGAQWVGCVPLLRILLLGKLAAPVATVAQNVIKSSGRAGAVLKADAWKKPLGFAAIFAGLPFGVVGLCWAKVFGDAVGACVDLAYALRVTKSGNENGSGK